MIIALAIMTVCSLLAVHLQVHIFQWHTQAKQYFKAVDLANNTFEQLHSHKSISKKKDSIFTINTAFSQPQPDKLYKNVTVTVSWKTPQNTTKQIVIAGGMLDAEKTA